MAARLPAFAFATALAVFLAACSAGNGGLGSMPYAGSDSLQTVSDEAAMAANRPTGSQNATAAIGVFNSLGSRVRDAGDQNEETGASVHSATLPANGRCVRGIEFFAPDRHGDANSTETALFFDFHCRQIARDTVRTYASTGSSSETVNRTVSFYSHHNSAAPVAVRQTIAQISNATFGQYGFPMLSGGFARTMQSQLTVGSAKTVLSGSEIVMQPSNSAVNFFCQDSAGYNATGIPSLDRTFGWQGGTSTEVTATRTDNGNGFVTWASTQTGSTYTGAIGSLSIANGTANTRCPIGTPDYTLAGGTAKYPYTIPLSVRFLYGKLWALTVTNATVGNGYSLNVDTTRTPGLPAEVNGRVSQGATTIASFTVNAFGNGLLTVTSTGAQYYIVDWSVVR